MKLGLNNVMFTRKKTNIRITYVKNERLMKFVEIQIYRLLIVVFQKKNPNIRHAEV